MVELAEHVAEILDIGPGTRVFEVDCGRGEFLLPLHQNGFIVGGIDADPEAIKSALAAMADGVFQVGAASSLDPAIPWHVVVCRSFTGSSAVSSAGALAKVEASAKAETSDLDYMRGVLARMFAKATHAIAILNVPSERQRWMLHALAEIGANAIQMEEVTIDDTSSRDRFNVFARV